MLTFSITNVCNLECLTDRDMQESRKNHQNCLMPLQFEMLYGNYLEFYKLMFPVWNQLKLLLDFLNLHVA